MLNDFDARSVAPQQAMDKHPCGMFDFQITNTFLKPSKDEAYLMLNVELTSPVGVMIRNYIVDARNMDDRAKQTIEIANKQISALCHVTNIYKITYPKDANGTPVMDQAARELRGGRGRMEVAFQKGQEPTAENLAGGYVEVRKVFDSAGNEPGKQGAAPQPQQASSQATQQAAPQPAQWGGQAANNPAPAQAAGWQPGPNAAAPAASPPWGASK